MQLKTCVNTHKTFPRVQRSSWLQLRPLLGPPGLDCYLANRRCHDRRRQIPARLSLPLNPLRPFSGTTVPGFRPSGLTPKRATNRSLRTISHRRERTQRPGDKLALLFGGRPPTPNEPRAELAGLYARKIDSDFAQRTVRESMPKT